MQEEKNFYKEMILYLIIGTIAYIIALFLISKVVDSSINSVEEKNKKLKSGQLRNGGINDKLNRKKIKLNRIHV